MDGWTDGWIDGLGTWDLGWIGWTGQWRDVIRNFFVFGDGTDWTDCKSALRELEEQEQESQSNHGVTRRVWKNRRDKSVSRLLLFLFRILGGALLELFLGQKRKKRTENLKFHSPISSSL